MVVLLRTLASSLTSTEAVTRTRRHRDHLTTGTLAGQACSPSLPELLCAAWIHRESSSLRPPPLGSGVVFHVRILAMMKGPPKRRRAAPPVDRSTPPDLLPHSQWIFLIFGRSRRRMAHLARLQSTASTLDAGPR
jgi:hypothetical protein